MTDRIEAAAEALFIHRDADVFYADIWKNYGCECGWSSELDDADSLREHQAEAVMAALDAYDGPKFSSVVHECCERPTEVDLRKRIAQEIGQEWQRRSDEWGYRVDSHQEGVLDGLAEAEEIARGIDPGEVE